MSAPLFHKLPRRDAEHHALQLVKSLAEFAAAAANRIKTIFCRGVYVAENTSRLTNVRVVRPRRSTSALQ
jgi:hypothetical protein